MIRRVELVGVTFTVYLLLQSLVTRREPSTRNQPVQYNCYRLYFYAAPRSNFFWTFYVCSLRKFEDGTSLITQAQIGESNHCDTRLYSVYQIVHPRHHGYRSNPDIYVVKHCFNSNIGGWKWIFAWVPFPWPHIANEPDEAPPTVTTDTLAASHACLDETHERLQTEIANNATMQKELIEGQNDRVALTRALAEVKGELRVERENLFILEKNPQHVRETDSAKLRKLNVLLGREREELAEVKADLDRYREIAQERNSDALLLGGVNLQAGFRTLPEIDAYIRFTLKGKVREWVQDMSEPRDGSWMIDDLPVVLADVFLQCQTLVMRLYFQYNFFFRGKVSSVVEGDENEAMDKETANFMLKHMRRHYSTLYPLTPGRGLETACDEVVGEVAGMLLRRNNMDMAGVHLWSNYLTKTGVQSVIKEYLSILVGVTLHPLATFSNDCGNIDAFNKKIHNNSIDGDSLPLGGECVVVFPVLIGELEAGQGFGPIGKKYILPTPQNASGTPSLVVVM